MKKILSLLTAVSMCILITGCDSKKNQNDYSKPYYSSPSEVTIEKLTEKTLPEAMVAYKGGFRQDLDFDGYNNQLLNTAVVYNICVKQNKHMYFNSMTEYDDGYHHNIYFTDDENDRFLYSEKSVGSNRETLTDEKLKANFKDSILGYTGDLKAEIISSKEKDQMYEVEIKVTNIEQNKELTIDTITLDPQTGFVTKIDSEPIMTEEDKRKKEEGAEYISVKSEIEYSADLKPDLTPKRSVEEQEKREAEQAKKQQQQ